MNFNLCLTPRRLHRINLQILEIQKISAFLEGRQVEDKNQVVFAWYWTNHISRQKRRMMRMRTHKVQGVLLLEHF